MDIKNENETTDSELKSVTKKRTGKKILLWCLGIVLFGIVAALGITAWICAALFDHKPLPVVSRQPDTSQYQSCISKFQVQPKEGESVQEAWARDKTVALSKKEVNAILDSITVGAREYLKVKSPDTTISDVYFKNGALHAKVSQKNVFPTPFGNYMNMRLILIPRIEDGHLYMDVKKLSTGTIDVSGEWIQEYIDNDLKHFETTDNGKVVVKMLKGLQLGEDNIKVTFNPMQVNMFLMQKALSIFSGEGGGGDLSEMLKLLQ